jgi:hypothetical protein
VRLFSDGEAMNSITVAQRSADERLLNRHSSIEGEAAK